MDGQETFQKKNKLVRISDNEFDESFRFILPGYNVRPVEMSGAIGSEQLKKLPNFISLRRSNAMVFANLFKNLSFIQLQKEIGQSSWFGFSIVLLENSPISRNQLIQLLRNKNIECRPIVSGNFLKNSNVLKYFDYELSGSFENAEYIDKHGLFVGNHHYDLTNEINYLYKSILSLIQNK